MSLEFSVLFQKEKQTLVDMSLKLYNEKLIVGTWGNLSMRVPYKGEDYFLVTPSGMDYEKTEVSDIVIVDKEGNTVSGNRKPTSELHMHLNIYKNRRDINAVFHTHSTCATSCAVAGMAIPMLVEDMVQLLGGEVRAAEYAFPGSIELAENALKALEGRKGVLLRNHGAIGAGKDAEEAYKCCILIEKSAQIFINAKLLGAVNVIDEEDARRMIDFYNNSYGQNR